MNTDLAIQVRTRLVVPDADAAIAWYADVLGAEPGMRHESGGAVAYAEVTVFGTTLALKSGDTMDPAPGSDGRAAAGVLLDVESDDPDRLAEAMSGAGAEVVIAVADQSYGARAGRVRDPFGVLWVLSTPMT